MTLPAGAGPPQRAAPVRVIIVHPEPHRRPGRWGSLLLEARQRLAEEHQRGFAALGAEVEVRLRPEGEPFGRWLRRTVAESLGPRGRWAPGTLVVLGSGAIPLATAADRRWLLDAGPAEIRANNAYSADAVALGARAVSQLLEIPDEISDNGLPRWLHGRGWPVRDRRSHWRLAVDVDSPLDLVLVARGRRSPRLRSLARVATTPALAAAMDRLAATADDPSRELLVAGRTSATTLRWLEERTRCRVRAVVEERGLRSALVWARPPASLLAAALGSSGPRGLGALIASLADGALVDSRVLIAHHRGGHETDWPPAEDRFASDLLLPEEVGDPWLRELTASAVEAPVPILLGGHGLVGPGPRLLFASLAAADPWTGATP